jgi:myo-inositol-1(or 4)-monophosphatase
MKPPAVPSINLLPFLKGAIEAAQASGAQGVRRGGSAALDLAYVAAGRLDGYWELGIKPWDIAAGICIVREAGGVVSAYDLSPLDLYSQKIMATNGSIHEALSRELEKVKDKPYIIN